MKRFVVSVIVFAILLCAGFLCSCFFLPSPTVRNSMLAVQKQKLEQLSKIKSPRVVLVGGSGLGMGMQTSELSERLNCSVYNMGLHAGLGLVYQMNAVSPEMLNSGDVVVLVPEYANFDGRACFGDQELVAMVFDIMPEHRKYISAKHWLHLARCMVQYGASKIRNCYLNNSDSSACTDKYDAFGDSEWGERAPDERRVFPDARHLVAEDFSPIVLAYIRRYVDTCQSRGVRVVVLPPAFQARSYDNQVSYINEVANGLEGNGTPFISSPRNYRMEDIYFDDTPYHLNFIGRRVRTERMVEDIRNAIRMNKPGL